MKIAMGANSYTQIEILRYMHAHHESRHHRMKEEHGEVLDEIEGIVRELDALSNELHMVSDHAVQLDANFSKYGYSAHLRMFVFLSPLLLC